MSMDGYWRSAETGTLVRIKGDDIERKSGDEWIPVPQALIMQVAGLGGDIWLRETEDGE